MYEKKERLGLAKKKQIKANENYSKVFSSIFLIVELILLHAVN